MVGERQETYEPYSFVKPVRLSMPLTTGSMASSSEGSGVRWPMRWAHS
jgi:hypothetical protein